MSVRCWLEGMGLYRDYPDVLKEVAARIRLGSPGR